jgi:hypothetical protein
VLRPLPQGRQHLFPHCPPAEAPVTVLDQHP